MLLVFILQMCAFSVSVSLYVLGFLFVNVELLVIVKITFFRASLFATVSCSTLLVGSRRSSVSAKSVDSVR